MDDTKYAVTRGEVKEYRNTEDLHRLIDGLLQKVEEERREGIPARLSIQIVYPDERAPVEGRVDEITGIVPDEFMRRLEIKEKRRKALEKARKARAAKRRKEEQLKKKRIAALKKARAAKKAIAKSRAAKAKKK